MSGILKHWKAKFIAGLLVVVPLVATYLALRFVLSSVDGVLAPLLERLLHRHIPGLGVAVTLVLVFIAGILTSHFLGRKLVRLGESLLGRLPLVSNVYKTAKELMEAVAAPKTRQFREIVMLEYPRKGLFAYGFVTSYATLREGDITVELANVFIPNPPVPTTGTLVVARRDELVPLDITTEEVFKIIVSAGLVAPKNLPVLAPGQQIKETPNEDNAQPGEGPA